MLKPKQTRRSLKGKNKNNRKIRQKDHFFIRKYASLSILYPLVNPETNTLTLSAQGQDPLSLPLTQDLSKLPKRSVSLWKDTLTVYDLGDEASRWLTQFLVNHRQSDQENSHNPDDPVKDDDPIPEARLVTLEDPEHKVYSRPAHPNLPGIHSPFADWSPISFGFTASLEHVNQGLIETGISKGNQIPMSRFRNNITISGTVPWEEDQWLVVR